MPQAVVGERVKALSGRGGSTADLSSARSERLPSALRRGLELMALVALGVAQPAFDVISKTPEFFPLRESSQAEVVLFALLMTTGVPAALLVLELVAGLAGPFPARLVHLGFLAVLSTIVAIPLVQGIVEVLDRSASGWLVLAGAALLGGGSALAYDRFRPVRTYLFALTPVPLAFLALFLIEAPTGRVVLPPVPVVAKPAPVVMLVFDELPVASLMDERRRIDAKRYPNFAALARNSTWYRRTTTVSDLSTSAVPAILTGSLPRPKTPPSASEQPRNLFTLLRRSHRLRAIEPWTNLCPAGPCDEAGLGQLPRRTFESVMDGMKIAAHATAPPDLERRLGELGEGVELGDPAAPFHRFVDQIGRAPRPELHFIHVLLPHYPWTRLPSGRAYERAAPLDLPRGFQGGAVQRWEPDPLLVRQEWQRHLLQVAYLDRLLGRLLRRLRGVGLYDRALVVAVADHGVSFIPGERMRDVTPANVHDIASVPLFIKAPGQRRGAVVDEPARTTDVLPTTMEILGGRVPWRVEGRSLTDRGRERRPRVTVTSSRLPTVTSSAKALDRSFRRALRRRVRIFGTGADGPDIVDRERHPEWIGRRVGDSGVRVGAPAAVRIDRRRRLERVSRASGLVPVLLSGRVLERAVPEGRELVLALNGRVAAVVAVNPWWAGPPTFSAVVPERLLEEGANSLEVFWTR